VYKCGTVCLVRHVSAQAHVNCALKKYKLGEDNLESLYLALRRITLISIGLIVLPLLVQPAHADGIDFTCSTGTSCGGTVAQNGSNFSSSGINLFNSTGPYSSVVPFTLSFDTFTGSIALTGTGIYTGENFVGNILNFGSFGVSTTDVAMTVFWGGLPSTIQALFGTSQGMDSASVIYLTGTGAAQSVDIFITPTPEPAALALFGTGVLWCGGLLRRRKKLGASVT
jgi:hypothetical protein